MKLIKKWSPAKVVFMCMEKRRREECRANHGKGKDGNVGCQIFELEVTLSVCSMLK